MGRPIESNKRVILYQYVRKAAYYPTIQIGVLCYPNIGTKIRIVEEQLGEAWNFLRPWNQRALVVIELAMDLEAMQTTG